MKTLIIGAGALGGLIAARLRFAGARAWMATRTRETAAYLNEHGLHVEGVGHPIVAHLNTIASLDDYLYDRDMFDLVILATKAHDAMQLADRLPRLLAPRGILLPIQNGPVAQMLADRLEDDRVIGGLSNLGATMTAVGRYEQRNAGHLLIGELSGGESARIEDVRYWLARGIDVRVTPNIQGAVWSKLLLNCSVTTLGAIAGRPMLEYIDAPDGREIFDRTYDEALTVALATGARPEPMMVDPIPPGWGSAVHMHARDAWVEKILNGYGRLKPSMLQDFERGKRTEIDFINGYVADTGRQLGIRTPMNMAVVGLVHAIERGVLTPGLDVLARLLDSEDALHDNGEQYARGIRSIL